MTCSNVSNKTQRSEFVLCISLLFVCLAHNVHCQSQKVSNEIGGSESSLSNLIKPLSAKSDSGIAPAASSNIGTANYREYGSGYYYHPHQKHVVWNRVG